MFTSSNFGWASSGTTQFTTYYRDLGQRTPGIGISSDDLVGSLWTPDISWTKAGTLATLGLTSGDYTITDAETNESISILIGPQITAAVPEPGILGLFALGLVGLGLRRRKA
jgi:hypothetical protein